MRSLVEYLVITVFVFVPLTFAGLARIATNKKNYGAAVQHGLAAVIIAIFFSAMMNR